MPLQEFEDQVQAPDSDDDFVQEQPVQILRTRESPRRRLIKDEEQEKEAEEGNVSTSTAPQSRWISRSKPNKRTLLNHDEDDDENQGFSTATAATTSSSRSWRDVPWSLFANKDSILVLGDWNGENGDDVHNNDDDFWPDMSYSDTDSSEDESADETEIGGARFNTAPVMRQAHESNQYGEMLGRAAEFGKPYLSHGGHERQTADTGNGSNKGSSNISDHLGSSHNKLVFSIFGVPSINRDRAVLSKTIRNSNDDIPGTSSTPRTSRSRDTTTTTNDDLRSSGKTSRKGDKRQISDFDDDGDSTPDLSDSENDDASNIDLGFAMNTRVFMADGTTKRIKKIQPGEYVLGPDRLPRLVIGTSAGRSPMIRVRELTQNVTHQPDDYFGLVTFICTPKQALRLATAQMQGIHVGHDDKLGLFQVSFRRLKRVQGAMVVVHSSESFQDSSPNARQRADAFAHNRSKDVIYWTLPKDRHDIVSTNVQLQTYHLTAALDFETGRLRYHALRSGFTDDYGMQEKLAYIWGTWMGDGDSIRTSIAINRKDKEQIARIEEVCHDLGLAAWLYKLSEGEKTRKYMGGRVRIIGRAHKRSNYFLAFLRRLGLGKPGSKYVPRWLRKESMSVREHFLAGLIDSDGCRAKQLQQFVRNDYGATPHDRDKSNQRRTYKDVPIATIYPKIAEGVFILARSLGIPYAVTYKPAKTRGHNPEETRVLIRQLDYPTLSLLAKRYHNFEYSHDHIRERLRVSSIVISAYLANKGNNKKLENFVRDQLFEKMPVEEIRPLVLLTRNPSRHHSVALRLDPVSDGLFVLVNNAVVASRE
ncbi:H(+)-transporting V1 sector ATPase subunit A [Linnemannia exigua]|uniref:H(+)-transporting V1 sector ATPase subunit A n=1 Tax=Linnemannia exigua TaxID=604196 RepID=A0AAD4D3J4_9FUNG|nr:H(+)-transporting V1 sector ATPase subunit A [Linnemannia exigua]